MDLDELISAYWEHYRLFNSTVREDRLRSENVFWAWEAIHSLAHGETNNEFWADPGAKGR